MLITARGRGNQGEAGVSTALPLSPIGQKSRDPEPSLLIGPRTHSQGYMIGSFLITKYTVVSQYNSSGTAQPTTRVPIHISDSLYCFIFYLYFFIYSPLFV